MTDFVTLQTEIYRSKFAISRMVDWLNEKPDAYSRLLRRQDIQARAERAEQRLVAARQDLAALLHEIWPNHYPPPWAPHAAHFYSFPREKRSEAP